MNSAPKPFGPHMVTLSDNYNFNQISYVTSSDPNSVSPMEYEMLATKVVHKFRKKHKRDPTESEFWVKMNKAIHKFYTNEKKLPLPQDKPEEPKQQYKAPKELQGTIPVPDTYTELQPVSNIASYNRWWFTPDGTPYYKEPATGHLRVPQNRTQVIQAIRDVVDWYELCMNQGHELIDEDKIYLQRFGTYEVTKEKPSVARALIDASIESPFDYDWAIALGMSLDALYDLKDNDPVVGNAWDIAQRNALACIMGNIHKSWKDGKIKDNDFLNMVKHFQNRQWEDPRLAQKVAQELVPIMYGPSPNANNTHPPGQYTVTDDIVDQITSGHKKDKQNATKPIL